MKIYDDFLEKLSDEKKSFFNIFFDKKNMDELRSQLKLTPVWKLTKEGKELEIINMGEFSYLLIDKCFDRIIVSDQQTDKDNVIYNFQSGIVDEEKYKNKLKDCFTKKLNLKPHTIKMTIRDNKRYVIVR